MNLEQERAAQAFRVAGEARGQGEAVRFLALARSLPAMLQTNGLLASWAFLLRERKEVEDPRNPAASRLLSALREGFARVLRPEERARFFAGADPDSAFLRRDENGGGPELSGVQLRRMTAEAIRSSVWLKRAAEALCDGSPAAPAAGAREAGA